MKTLIRLNNKRSIIPKKFRGHDNRYPEALVKYFLVKFTKKGDVVFDPFAGLGTTLIVAEKMGRIPFGIEIDKRRCEYIKTKLINKNNVICGDSLRLNKYKLPKLDFSITSPPYNPADEKNYLSGKGGYRGYLKNIKNIYTQIKRLMKKNSYVVIEVANLKKGNEITLLAWDIAREVSKVFHFEGEIIVKWTNGAKRKKNGNYGYGYDHSYCLIFKKE